MLERCPITIKYSLLYFSAMLLGVIFLAQHRNMEGLVARLGNFCTGRRVRWKSYSYKHGSYRVSPKPLPIRGQTTVADSTCRGGYS